MTIGYQPSGAGICMVWNEVRALPRGRALATVSFASEPTTNQARPDAHATSVSA